MLSSPFQQLLWRRRESQGSTADQHSFSETAYVTPAPKTSVLPTNNLCPAVKRVILFQSQIFFSCFFFVSVQLTAKVAHRISLAKSLNGKYQAEDMLWHVHTNRLFGIWMWNSSFQSFSAVTVSPTSPQELSSQMQSRWGQVGPSPISFDIRVGGTVVTLRLVTRSITVQHIQGSSCVDAGERCGWTNSHSGVMGVNAVARLYVFTLITMVPPLAK